MSRKHEFKRILDEMPKGILLIPEEAVDGWIAKLKDCCDACQSDYDDIKADAEVVWKTANFERDKKYIRDNVEKGFYVIYPKEVWDEYSEKAKKWDSIYRDPDATIILSEVFAEVNREKEKLEVLKEHFAKQDLHSGYWPFGRARIGRWRAKLELILVAGK